MIKKFVAMVMVVMTLTGCSINDLNTSPNIYNGDRMVERVNNYVEKVTDLKTMRIRFVTNDGEATEWLPSDTTLEEVAPDEWSYSY